MRWIVLVLGASLSGCVVERGGCGGDWIDVDWPFARAQGMEDMSAPPPAYWSVFEYLEYAAPRWCSEQRIADSSVGEDERSIACLSLTYNYLELFIYADRVDGESGHTRGETICYVAGEAWNGHVEGYDSFSASTVEWWPSELAGDCGDFESALHTGMQLEVFATQDPMRIALDWSVDPAPPGFSGYFPTGGGESLLAVDAYNDEAHTSTCSYPDDDPSWDDALPTCTGGEFPPLGRIPEPPSHDYEGYCE